MVTRHDGRDEMAVVTAWKRLIELKDLIEERSALRIQVVRAPRN